MHGFASICSLCKSIRRAEACGLTIEIDGIAEQLLFASKRRIEACLRNPQLGTQIRHRDRIVAARPEEAHRFP
jgi:hypothetical protein